MITINDINRFNNTLSLYALTSDELPTDYVTFNHENYKITNASSVMMIDTGEIKIFDEANHIWCNL